MHLLWNLTLTELLTTFLHGCLWFSFSLDIIWLPYSENVYFNVCRRLREVVDMLQAAKWPWSKWWSGVMNQVAKRIFWAKFKFQARVAVFVPRRRFFWVFFRIKSKSRFLRGWWTWFSHIRPLDLFFCRTATGAQTPQPCLDKRLLLKQIVFCLNRSSSFYRICCTFS